MMGSGTGNRLFPQTRDKVCHEEGFQSIALNLLEFEIPTILPVPDACMVTKRYP